MRPAVSCDFSERSRKFDMRSSYFMEETSEQGGSAAPRAMLFMRGRTAARLYHRARDCSIHAVSGLLLRYLGHERHIGSVTFMLHVVGWDKTQRGGVYCVTLSGWRCGIDN